MFIINPSKTHLKSLVKIFIPLKYSISTELIKKHHQGIIGKQQTSYVSEYPKTFEGKVQLLNDPRSIKLIQVVEYGVKYKKGNKWFPLILLILGLFQYFQEAVIPSKIIDRYFMISGESNQYPSGYIGAMFSYGQPFYIFLPLMTVVYQMSRFVSFRKMLGLMGINFLVNSALGKYIVDDRLSKYEVWDYERIMYGEGMLLSYCFAFWSQLGFKNAFTAFKSKVFLKSIPGVGITRSGIATPYFCLAYIGIYLLLSYKESSRNQELVASSIVLGLLYGLLLRKINPLL